MNASNFFACASVAANALPSGNQSSTINSNRLESGKNCCSINRKPNTPSANAVNVSKMVVLRHSTHQFTIARKRL